MVGYKLYILLFVCLHQFTEGQNDTEICELPDGEKGQCVLIDKCQHAQSVLKNKILPNICRFQEKTTNVCCKVERELSQLLKSGELSLAKCNEYYPEPDEDTEVVLVPGGEPSLVKEFPHMAVVGFGEKDDIQWQCGGSLVSKNFVLTAAHCLHSTQLGPAKFVRLGDLDISTETDDAGPQDFTIKRRIPHPGYKFPSKYNDIGLIELDRNAVVSLYVTMACLDTKKNHNEKQMIATGWGKTEYYGDSSNFLLKVNLDLVEHQVCNKSYVRISTEQLPNGVLTDMHICAGGKAEQDTCQGDSGGPLQIKVYDKKNFFKHFDIVGVTSFGKPCGISRAPGVYTRVYNYLSWIENIVWSS